MVNRFVATISSIGEAPVQAAVRRVTFAILVRFTTHLACIAPFCED